MPETMPVPQANDPRNFAREMPKLSVDAATAEKFKAGSEEALRDWKAKVVENSQREAAELIELNRRIAAGEFQPDPKNYAREMKRPDFKKTTGLAGWFNKLISKN